LLLSFISAPQLSAFYREHSSSVCSTFLPSIMPVFPLCFHLFSSVFQLCPPQTSRGLPTSQGFFHFPPDWCLSVLLSIFFAFLFMASLLIFAPWIMTYVDKSTLVPNPLLQLSRDLFPCKIPPSPKIPSLILSTGLFALFSWKANHPQLSLFSRCCCFSLRFFLFSANFTPH